MKTDAEIQARAADLAAGAFTAWCDPINAKERTKLVLEGAGPPELSVALFMLAASYASFVASFAELAGANTTETLEATSRAAAEEFREWVALAQNGGG